MRGYVELSLSGRCRVAAGVWHVTGGWLGVEVVMQPTLTVSTNVNLWSGMQW
jgi:hypothetical protein